MMKCDGTRIVYAQKSDCCDLSEMDQRLSLTITDGGGGGYVVMRTRRWAIGSEDDLDKLVDVIREALVEAAKIE